MPQRFFYRANPWDLDDANIEASLAMLAGDVGVDALSVFAIAPEIDQTRPRPLGGRWTFSSPAGAHFQPDAKRYSTARIRPVAAGWFKSRNPLERIAMAAQHERLSLRARLSCCRGRELVRRHPYAACVNVFGDASADRLCLAHPDVRQYVTETVHDLTANYPASAIEFEDLHADPLDFLPERENPSLDDMLAFVKVWCFCPACIQRAVESGIDAESVRTSLIQHWRRAANAPQDAAEHWREAVERDAQLAAYAAGLRKSAAALVRQLHGQISVPLRIDSPAGIAWLGPLHEFQDDRLGLLVTRPARPTDDDERSNLPLPPLQCDVVFHDLADFGDGPALVARVHQTSQAQVAAIGFDHFGSTPEACFDWVRQAIRYARRESGSA